MRYAAAQDAAQQAWSTPDWWVAAGTLALAVVTLALVVVTYSMWRSERAARRDEARERREVQNRLDAVQSETVAVARRGQAEQIYVEPIYDEDWLVGVTVHNGSHAPVYRVLVTLMRFVGPPLTLDMEILFQVGPVDGVLPGQTDVRGPREQGVQIEAKRRVRLSVEFRDAGNRWWVRDAEGLLRDVDEDPDADP